MAKNYINSIDYQGLLSGINPVALTAVIEEIKQGGIYILKDDEIENILSVDENDNLVIEQ